MIQAVLFLLLRAGSGICRLVDITDVAHYDKVSHPMTWTGLCHELDT